MFRKLLLSLVWFPASVLLLVINFSIYPHAVIKDKATASTSIISPLGDITPYHIAASSNTSQVLGTRIIAADARTPLLSEFLASHDSPFAEYASVFVEEADKNGIDFRLVVAIAMCESNLGKRIPKDSFNAWGIAVYTGQQSGANFQDWPTAIKWVSKYMRERYLDRGHDTLREIGAIYAPPSVQTGHSWSKCVEEFQRSIF